MVRIKSIHLSGYKRFTDLTIRSLPANVRLVVLVGPNGSGKSSVFDAFLLKSITEKFNRNLTGGWSGYYEKMGTEHPRFAFSSQVAAEISIEFDSPLENAHDLSPVLYVRTAYRLESDFEVPALSKPTAAREQPRVVRIIDADKAVADNYQRLAWQRMSDLESGAPDNQTFGQYRREAMQPLQEAIGRLFNSPPLELQDLGVTDEGATFRFTKAAAKDFPYRNLSGGEKAAFDLLLDIFVKAREYGDAIYCIDEPETHLATALHGAVLHELLNLLPEESQLWIATHSAGFIREAHRRMKEYNDVAFLDFSGHDFDSHITIEPTIPDAAFWRTMYRVSLADLADLIAPSEIILCEGNGAPGGRGHDAEIYQRIFRESHPEALFFGVGSASEVEKTHALISLLGEALPGAQVWAVRDRDEMTDGGREQYLKRGIRVLRRREIENYLYDRQVIKTFVDREVKEVFRDRVIDAVEQLMAKYDKQTDDQKSIRQQVLQVIKQQSGLRNLGNTNEEFALAYLAPALASTPDVFAELEEDIFGAQA